MTLTPFKSMVLTALMLTTPGLLTAGKNLPWTGDQRRY